jgi:hypothetical protein
MAISLPEKNAETTSNTAMATTPSAIVVPVRNAAIIAGDRRRRSDTVGGDAANEGVSERDAVSESDIVSDTVGSGWEAKAARTASDGVS